jgi:hypothetical protein
MRARTIATAMATIFLTGCTAGTASKAGIATPAQ